MAVANVCARTGRVVLNRTATGQCLLNFQTARFLSISSRVTPICLTSKSEVRQGCGYGFPVGPRFQHTAAAVNEKTVAKPVEKTSSDGEYKDRYIPMTRKTLMQNLLQEAIFLTDEEKKLFETFSLSLDSAIINQHKGLLAELKSLFDPLNPDKDTIESRRYNRRERLDHEFWLLQKLATIMEKANFHELPKTLVEDVLREHNVGGVLVSVHPEKYDVIRYWVVGKVTVRPSRKSWYHSILKALKIDSADGSAKFYKRVVVAVRLKQDDHLFLKAFREVPVDRLSQVLPAGSVRMTNFDRRLLLLSGGIGLGGVLGKLVASTFSIPANWTLVLAGLSAASAAQLWTTFKNRQQVHLIELSKTLYYKNIINNRGLLTLLMDKAEDEIFKEVLLTYAFLLASRPPSSREKASESQKPDELGSMPSSILQQKISDWIHFKTGALVDFNPTEGIELLSKLGILTKDKENNLHVVALKPALKQLPPVNPTLFTRIEEYDLIEGFEVERSILEESEEEYTLIEKLRKQIGWF